MSPGSLSFRSLAHYLAAAVLVAATAHPVRAQDPPLVAPSAPVLERVAPGVISTDGGEAFPALSPDGGTLWFATHDPDWTGHAIVLSRWIDGAWSAPEPAPFSAGPWEDRAARPSPDGRRLYFASNRPRPGEVDHDLRDWDVWMVERVAEGTWGEPRFVPEPVSTTNPEYHPSPVASGALYFASFDREGGAGRSDLYLARPDGAGWRVERLGEAINTEHSEPDVYVDPEERFAIVTSTGREDALGGDDLYLSVREADGWTPLVNLGAPINSEAYEYGAFVSPDGRWLWFTSHRGKSADLYRIETSAVPALAEALDRPAP